MVKNAGHVFLPNYRDEDPHGTVFSLKFLDDVRARDRPQQHIEQWPETAHTASKNPDAEVITCGNALKRF